MTRDERLSLAHWLAQYKSHEIIAANVLDDLLVYDIRYSQIERRLYFGKLSVAVSVRSRDEFVAAMPTGTRMQLAPGQWRGVHILDVARGFCRLAELGDPAEHERGTLTRFNVYLTALERGHDHGEGEEFHEGHST